MHVFRTVAKDDQVRIEEESGAAVTLYFRHDTAVILSIYVPKADRDDGIGSALLSAAESEACKRGVTRIEADFSSEIEGMPEFFEAMDYEVRENGPVCAIDTKELLASESAKKLLKKNLIGTNFTSLEEFGMSQWDDLLEYISKFSLRIGVSDMAAFSKLLSGVTYDKKGELQTMILCSEWGEDVHVEFLVSAKKAGNAYVMAALRGMLMEIYASGGGTRYPRITAYCAHENVSRLMERALSKKPDEIGLAMYAVKELKEAHVTDIADEPDDDMDDEWRREIARVPLQANIEWKAGWYRDRLREKAKSGDEARASENREKEKTPTAEENRNLEQETHPDTSAFPYELGEPLDMDYGYDKDEDETDGLISDGIRRITIDNLDEFRDILPVDALYDIPRPWYRGLIEGDGTDPSYLVYEVKDADTEKTGSSEIRWIALADDARKLLDEYTNEAGIAGIATSTVEAVPSKVIQAALSEAGFETVERESDTIEISVGDLAKHPFASRKTPDYVMALMDINERQFKRGIGNCMIHNRKGLLHDLAFLPMEWFEQDVSSVVLTDNRVSGVLLIHQLASKRLSVDLLFSSSGDAKIDIIRMIARSIRAATEKYPKDTPVLIRRHDKNVSALTGRLFPNVKGDKILYGERKEV